MKSLNCCQCSKEYFVERKNKNTRVYQFKKKGVRHFCSKKCKLLGRGREKNKIVVCFQCGSEFERTSSQIKRSKNNFCSCSCAGIYNSTHKTHGIRRSKLEEWLEKELSVLFPNLEFHFNRKDAINSELDIYLPSLKLAFELNGIFHYEAIFGEEKFQKIRNNDERKFAACLERGIELCIIDSSGQKYFKPFGAKKYLDIVAKIIRQKWCKMEASNSAANSVLLC